MNRVYYAMFYATLALLATRDLNSAKHSGVISLFHREFVRTGLFPRELAKSLNAAFDGRMEGDYGDFAILAKEELARLVASAGEFIEKTRQILQSSLHSEAEDSDHLPG